MPPTDRRRTAWAALGILLPAALGIGIAAAQNPIEGKRLYVDPASPAAKQAAEWRRSRPKDAERMRRIAAQPHAIWLGDWNRDIRGEVNAMVSGAQAAGAVGVFVAYNIPNRDCGEHSAGGARSGNDYRRWTAGIAEGIRRRQTVVIIEPDGLATNECLPARIKDERYVLMRDAVERLKKQGAVVYLDAGNSSWHRPEEMADRLRKAGIEMADGFALNVANFHATKANVAYGERLSALLGGKHFVIDTSRNGRGASVVKEWCNARGQALGPAPTTRTGHRLVDAYLWVKTPGQSDGPCNGGPRAGAWWADYALELMKAAEVLGNVLPE